MSFHDVLCEESTTAPQAKTTHRLLSYQVSLENLRRLVDADRPWYEAVGLAAERANEMVERTKAIMGEDITGYVTEKGSSLSGKITEMLISGADVDALKPAYVIFKALFEAVQGTASNRDKLIGLLGYCVQMVKSIPEANTNQLPQGVVSAIEDLANEVEKVMDLADSFRGKTKPNKRWNRFKRRVLQVADHANVEEAISDHEKQFDRILGVLTASAAVEGAKNGQTAIVKINQVKVEIDQMKVMAEQNAQATKDTVHGMGELKDAVEDTTQTSKEVMDSIGELKNAVDDNASAAVEDAQNIQTVVDKMEQLKVVAAQIAQTTKGTVHGFDQLADTVQGNTHTSKDVMDTIGELKDTVNASAQLAKTTVDRALVVLEAPTVLTLPRVPRLAPILPKTHVRREPLVEKIVDDLINTGRRASAAYALVGMGGSGKSILASSVVRDERVRSSFRHGMFWLSVGEGRKEEVALLLEDLARELAIAPAVERHTCPDEFVDADQTIRYLAEIRKRGNLRCLVVLDNVWDVEVVNAFASAGFHLLVTTRKRSVISPQHSGACTEVGDMTPEQSLDVLRMASQAGGSLPEPDAMQVTHNTFSPSGRC